MNDLPPIRTAPAAQRNRRAGRAAPKRRRRKKAPLLTWKQGAALGALLVGLILILTDLSRAQGALAELRAAREAERIAWEKEVGSHQVKYRDLIERYAAMYQIDPAYVAAIIKRESDYDPRAESRKGALGLMQFIPSTFSWVKNNCGYRNADISILNDPEASIKMGCYLIRYIINFLQNDDPVVVACAYHAGWGDDGVSYWLKHYSSDGRTLTLDQIPADDTRYYAGKVAQAYAIYQQYAY